MLKGTLDHFTMPEIFRLVSANKTGRLDVARDSGTGKLYFRDGAVYYAESSLARDPLGQRLIRSGQLTEGDLRTALDVHAKSGKRIGEVLVDIGLIDRQRLEAALLAQIEDAVLDLLRWEAGEFTWTPGATMDVELSISVRVEDLILDASRRLDELAVIQRRIPATTAVPSLASEPPSDAAEINVSADEWRMMALADGRRTIRDIAAAVQVDDLMAMRTFYGLVSSGLLEIDPGEAGPAPPTGPRESLHEAAERTIRKLARRRGPAPAGDEAPVEPRTQARRAFRRRAAPADEPTGEPTTPGGSSGRLGGSGSSYDVYSAWTPSASQEEAEAEWRRAAGLEPAASDVAADRDAPPEGDATTEPVESNPLEELLSDGELPGPHRDGRSDPVVAELEEPLRQIAQALGAPEVTRDQADALTLDEIGGAIDAPVSQDADDEQERLEAERLEAERLEAERLEAERLEAERLEQERVEAERVEAGRLEAERLEAERLEAERLEAERLEQERVEAERVEAERVQAERLEAERLEQERLEQERLEQERLEQERLEQERLEQERLDAERLEAERLEREQLDAERVEQERVEQERVEQERVDAERLEAERLERERLDTERVEQERVDAERLETERLEAERLETEHLETERLEAERRRPPAPAAPPAPARPSAQPAPDVRIDRSAAMRELTSLFGDDDPGDTPPPRPPRSGDKKTPQGDDGDKGRFGRRGRR